MMADRRGAYLKEVLIRGKGELLIQGFTVLFINALCTLTSLTLCYIILEISAITCTY